MPDSTTQSSPTPPNQPTPPADLTELEIWAQTEAGKAHFARMAAEMVESGGAAGITQFEVPTPHKNPVQ